MNSIWKGSPQEHSCEIIPKSDHWFQRRRFFKNFFMSLQCKKPPFTRAMFLDGSKFCEQHLKTVNPGTFLWNYSKIGPAVPDKIFLRISSCHYSERSPNSAEPCFWMDQSFANTFWKGSPKEHFCEIISKSDQRFQRRRFLKNCLKNSISLPWQPEFLMESNSMNNFWRGPPKKHSCQVWSKLAQWFGRRCLKKLLTTHRRTTDTSPP